MSFPFRVQIQDLNNAVRRLRAEKDQLQENLAVEKRVNSENSAKLETKPTTLSMHGLHDYDPIDMSFLPQWEGLSLSNDKIRAMPSDTLKILIQTILQDLRTRLANDSNMSPAVGSSVTQAFNFLNRWYATPLMLFSRADAILFAIEMHTHALYFWPSATWLDIGCLLLVVPPHRVQHCIQCSTARHPSIERFKIC